MKSNTPFSASCALILASCCLAEILIKSNRSKSSLFSIKIRNTPKAARRKAKGSLSPVGVCPIAKIPNNVSKRSAIAKD
jgi:hypothetical protein